MPTYDYRCRKCQHRFERFHSITDERPQRCPRCGGRAARVPAGGAGLLFKGSGFYITDYRSDSYKERAKSEKPAGEKSGDAKPGAPSGGGKTDSAGAGPPRGAGRRGGAGAGGRKKKGD